MKPWREIAQPHKDVLEGTFKQSEFAADISQVANGQAGSEYQDAEKFFSRTYITEGMRLLLISVAQRLAGVGGDPVIQLQTAFGGGKTHTMLAVYHLANRKVETSKLMGIPSLLDEAGIQQLPNAKVAVIDGINISPSQPTTFDGVSVNTIWGNLAHQLLGLEGYELVRNADIDGTSPGKEVLIDLLRKAAPCVILVDELVSYIRQFVGGAKLLGGTFESNLTFIQALTEALKSVPNAIMLASLPESNLEVGGDTGQRALDSLEKYFGRVEAVWKPVATEEAFEIVRRRLFESAGNDGDLKATAREFADLYRNNAEKFPIETQVGGYYDRLISSYPIHPEVFDRLYEDWSTLDKFQRTRGVLQYLAIVIHRLWNSDNKDYLIMPGSIPLEDANVVNKSIHYLPQGWQPVIESEIDGNRSETVRIDGTEPRFGSVQAARRTARTIFLGSAPATSAQTVRGVKSERILLGVVQPGQVIGVYEDVIKRLRDRLHYLYSEQDNFWFDTKPNLRREMESRKANIDEREKLLPLLKDKVNLVFGRQHRFAGIHVFTPSLDVPDDIGIGPRLVVLNLDAGYSRGEANMAFKTAQEILSKRGDQPRQKQNRLIFLAPDAEVISRLKEQGRIFLAWQSIVRDIREGVLNHDIANLNQAIRNEEGASKVLGQMVRDAYKWLIAPSQDIVAGAPTATRWEAIQVSPVAQNLIQEIENKLKEEEWVVYEWAPIHLKGILDKWYFKDGDESPALKVWNDCCQYLYLPRVLNADIFQSTLSKGTESRDFYGYADAKEDNRYLGFKFGINMLAVLNERSLVIKREVAQSYFDKLIADEKAKREQEQGQPTIGNADRAILQPTGHDEDVQKPIVTSEEIKNLFFGSKNLNAISAKMEFSQLIDEIAQHFTSQFGVDVKIRVEIEAQTKEKFDNNLQRTVNENCKVLNVKGEFDSHS